MEIFEENHTTLFTHASQENITTYLNEAIKLVEKYNYTEQFYQSIPETVFAALEGHKEI